MKENENIIVEVVKNEDGEYLFKEKDSKGKLLLTDAQDKSVYRYNDYIDYYSEEWNDLKKSANTEYRHNKCVVKENTLGYNEFYIIKGGKKLTAQGDEAMNDITSDNTTAQVRNAFKKQAKSKKKNKV